MVMKKAEYARISDDFGHPSLEKVSNMGYKLKEAEGQVSSCESLGSNGTFYLKIKLVTPDKNFNHTFKTTMPIPVVVGDKLRIFYEKEEDPAEIQAYELLKENKVVRNGGLENIEFEF